MARKHWQCPKKVKRRLICEYRTTCVYCLRRGKNTKNGQYDPDGNIWTADHIIPRSHGGHDGLDNLCLSCQQCNCTKSNSMLYCTYSRQDFLTAVRKGKPA